MSEELDDAVADAVKGATVPLYLLVGEEFLVRQAADKLVKALLPDASAGLNLAVMDGASPKEVSQELATLPLFPGRKIVLCRDPEFIAPKKGRGDALGKVRDAWKAGRKKEGARRLLALAARAGWGVSQLDPDTPGSPSRDEWKEELDVDLADADAAFLREVQAFCVEERVTAPEGDVSQLVTLFEKGLPPGQILVIAASDVDTKNGLVKWAHDAGSVIERKVSGRQKDLDLTAFAAEVLKPFKKKLAGSAEVALRDRLGGNMRLVQSELEKLATYANGPTIEKADVELLVSRVREEEYMELANAIQERKLDAALAYVNSAIEQGAHGLMLLGAIAGIIRQLVEAVERLGRLNSGKPFRMTFNEFKYELFPKIEAEMKARKARVPHPFAVYAGMQSAARYGRKDLLRALVACAEADLALKSSGDSRMVIERLLLGILGR